MSVVYISMPVGSNASVEMYAIPFRYRKRLSKYMNPLFSNPNSTIASDQRIIVLWHLLIYSKVFKQSAWKSFKKSFHVSFSTITDWRTHFFFVSMYDCTLTSGIISNNEMTCLRRFLYKSSWYDWAIDKPLFFCLSFSLYQVMYFSIDWLPSSSILVTFFTISSRASEFLMNRRISERV